MEPYTIAVCQMDSKNDKEENLAFAEMMIKEASKNGAVLIAFPETMNFMGKGYRHQAEKSDGETMSRLKALAKENAVWIMTGSIPSTHESGKPMNTLSLISPDGKVICSYSKLHMFDVELEDGPAFQESQGNTAGKRIVTVKTPLGHMGFSICYDLRFGEMYRLMALAGAQIIFVPSSFTYMTGKAHWETLLRARAIENGVYIIAPAQIGTKSVSDTYGHSMVVDPWGRILAVKEDGVGLIYADIDIDYVEKVRLQLPSLKNRRTDIYDLKAAEGCLGTVVI